MMAIESVKYSFNSAIWGYQTYTCNKYGRRATGNTWSVKKSRIMPKTGWPLLSLSVMDRDHELMMIAMNAKETLHTEELPRQMSLSLP